MKVYPFGPLFFAMLAFVIAATAVAALVLRKKSKKLRTWILCLLCVFNIVTFFIYKYFLSIDAEFLVLSNIERFNWFNELPLQFCNINMFLIPIGILLNSRAVMGFSFYLAPLGALMALMFPESAFSGYAISTPRILGYYLTHVLVMLCGLLLVALDFYRPRFKDMARILLAFVLLALGAHHINILLRHTVCENANYFYTFGSDISILALFWQLIPFPFFYELPAILIAVAYMGIVDLFFYIPHRIRQKKAPTASGSKLPEENADATEQPIEEKQPV